MNAPRRKDWTMPPWMEPYRKLIGNTGGNAIEEMMNDETDARINLPRAVLAVAVKSQVGLLYALRKAGMLDVPSLPDV